MSKETINTVKKFLNSYSIETTPNVYEKYGSFTEFLDKNHDIYICLLYTSPSPRDRQKSRMPSSA